MYEVYYDGNYWWIMKDGVIFKELGSFIEPLSPEIIIKEIENEV